MAVKKIPKNIKFEDALSELEEQVHLLEGGELPLEQALDVFKYGVELSRVCTSKLETVKQEVEKIVVTDDGADYRLEAFQDLEVK
jgi:exodeoxyribonuclease VII small subunit